MVISPVVSSKVGVMTERVRRLKEQMFESEVRISIERLRFLLDTYKNGKEQSPVLKRAEFTDRMLSDITIFIDENPIVGTASEYPRGALFFPEQSTDGFANESDFGLMLGNLKIKEEDAQVFKEALDFWKDKSVTHRVGQVVRQLYPELLKTGKAFMTTVSYSAPINSTHGLADYGKVLNKGLNGVIQEAEEAMATLSPGEADFIARQDYLNSVIITLNAVIKFAKRYASLAREMAREASDPKRKTELEKLAATCDWVPANPARDFYEAVQSFWFVHLAQWMDGAEGCSPGRFSWYMYPFYEKDREAGRITEEEAIELIELLFLKMMSIEYMITAKSFAGTQGSRFQNLNLCGLTPNGDDATNDVDFMCLEAQRRVKLVQPTLSVLYHRKISEKFLSKCVDVIRETGLGQPQFVNFPLAVQRTIYYHQASLEEARSIGYMGCQPFFPQGKGAWLLTGTLNSAKLIELVLNNGKDPVSGIEVGPQTGEAEKFRSYDELKGAVKKQAQYLLPKLIQIHFIEFATQAKFTPQILQSALTDDCIKKGKDILDGGARYPHRSTDFIATIDLANSLAAVKKLVFEEKAITMKELLDALKVDFQGKEDVQLMLLQAPKYGNDDEYVDQIARWCYDMLYDEFKKAAEVTCPTGGIGAVPEAYSAALHFSSGLFTGALPSGRNARLPLTDATVSAMPGTDKNGPTALINSATRVMDMEKWGSNHLNMKFLPSVLEGRESARNLLNLVRVYMDLGGSHVQFNCISNRTLLDAQANPEKYRDLVVRVAGFSAYFIQLSKEIQDEIIKRTELTF